MIHKDGRKNRDLTDITGSDLAEDALRVIFDTSQAGIILVNPQGTIVFANTRMAEMFGMTLEELIGTSYPEHLHESEKSVGDDRMRRLIKGEIQAVSTERHYVRADGSDFWGYLSGRRLESAEGSLKALVGIIADITERKQAEAERLDMERRLLHAQKLESLGILAGGIAHDFNNLLMAMLGNLEMSLLKLPPVSEARAGIEEAVRAGRRAADLTGQMLAYSGRGRFEVEEIDLNSLVTENVNLLKIATSKTVTLNLLLDKTLPPVLADAAQIQQVVMNLIINASEALGERPGVITITTGLRDYDQTGLSRSRIEKKPAPGRYLMLEVTDTGDGMEDETLQRLFDPFFSTKFTGRGLGMSAVLGIVKGHSGAIMVETEPGNGTSVRVLLPLLFPASAEAPQPAASPVNKRTDPRPALSGTVLIADDEEMVLNICTAIVESLGCRVLTAKDGEEAVRIFQESSGSIDLVLLDLTMPRMDGLAAFEKLRQIRPDIRVILSSGYSEQELSERYAGSGIGAFIQKPFHIDQLQTLLARMLARG
ncbi:MAG: PAS domain S-box protein [Nitrospirae bacterium]|nr:MAG: PAS domain S-box protein [Nitrospirota bacterium]